MCTHQLIDEGAQMLKMYWRPVTFRLTYQRYDSFPLQVVAHRCILETTLLISYCAQRTMYHAVHAALHSMHLASPCNKLHQQSLFLLLRFAPAFKVCIVHAATPNATPIAAKHD